MTSILLIAEHDGSELNGSTAKSLSCASAIGGDVDIVVFAEQADAIAGQAAQLAGARKVLACQQQAGQSHLAAVLAPQIADMAAGYTHVLGPSTTFGKDLMPRVAALLGVGQVADIMDVEGPYRFRRPIYAGNAIITVEAPESETLVGTVRTASYRAADASGSAPVESVTSSAALPDHTRFVSLDASAGDRPDLQSAQFVVSGGRALGSEENFELIYKLADSMGAGVGASRAAVDAGYVPNDMQVGQTGKIIAPDLYVAIGISGAIQHLTGIKDAGTIVAINKDPEAPIFEISDIGLVGDLFNVVPELTEALSG